MLNATMTPAEIVTTGAAKAAHEERLTEMRKEAVERITMGAMPATLSQELGVVLTDLPVERRLEALVLVVDSILTVLLENAEAQAGRDAKTNRS